MKSKTSFFNGTAFVKSLTRFAPVWVIYTVGCLLVVLSFISDSQPAQSLGDLDDTVLLMALAGCGYALVNAQLLFGDLFNSRLCNALHAMPMRREGWFLTNVLAGLCYGFVPNLVVALCFLPRLEWYASAAFVWLLVANLEYLFFFALAVFCVFCTGNRFAMALVYGLINFLAMLAAWFVDTLYIPLLQGVVFTTEPFAVFCPLVQLISSSLEGDFFLMYDKTVQMSGLTFGWIYLIVLSALAVILLAGSLLLYRKRHLEVAGDFVAVKCLAPVVLVVFTLTMGALFQLFNDIFLGEGDIGVFLISGLAIGYFTGQMMIQRRVKVFQWRSFLGFGVLTAVLLGSIGVVSMDPFGIEQWLPEASQVRTASAHDGYYYYNTDGQLTEVMKEGDIQEILDIHEKVLQELDDDRENSVPLTLEYRLNSGQTVRRKYWVDTESEAGVLLKQHLSKPQIVLGYKELATCQEMVSSIIVEYGVFTGAEAEELISAIYQDCLEGNMAQNWNFHGETPETYAFLEVDWVTTDWKNDIKYLSSFEIFTDAKHTVQWLKEREDQWKYQD